MKQIRNWVLLSRQKVRKGKLFVLCVDPESDIDNRLATRQLITSVEKYVASDRFDPRDTLQSYEIEALFHQSLYQKAERISNSNSAIAK